jgi:Zn-dependent metalloprotease
MYTAYTACTDFDQLVYLAAKALGGYSWEKVGKVWYKTMTTSGRIPVDCNFEMFAKVTIDVAGQEEFGSEVRDAIRKAWEQVGVTVPEPE